MYECTQIDNGRDGAWQMRVAKRQPYPASSAAKNGSKIANRNLSGGNRY